MAQHVFKRSKVNSIARELTKTCKIFWKLYGLEPNILKCDVAGINSLKGVKMAICGIKCSDLTTETIES